MTNETAAEIIDYIESNCGENGITIAKNRNIDGGPYWRIAGNGVQASGYHTFLETWEVWLEGIEHLKERDIKYVN